MRTFLSKLLIVQFLGVTSLFADLRMEIVRGSAIRPFTAEVANISNIVFKEYPYLYGIEHDAAFYMAKYGHCTATILCLVYEESKLIGYTIGLPLKAYASCFQQPFLHSQFDIDRLFYIGEVALLPEFRGQGLGKMMLLQMEQLVRQEEVFFSLCLVHIDERCVFVKPPLGHHSLCHLWHSLSFNRCENLSLIAEWPNVGDKHCSQHRLIYWIKPLHPDRCWPKHATLPFL